MTAPGTRTKAASTNGVIATQGWSEAYLFATTANSTHAQYAAGAPIADAVGPFTVTSPLRTVQIVLGAGGAGSVVYTVTGTYQDGTAQTETITATGAGTYEGVKLWQTITAFSSDINPGGTTNLNCSAWGFDPPSQSIYVATTAGTIVVRPAEGTADVTYTVAAFSRHNIRARWVRITSTGTPLIIER